MQTAIKLAKLDPECGSILVTMDADNDCPKTAAPLLKNWAAEVLGETPCEIVIANKEYEAWFLGSMESLRGHCGISQNACSLDDPESIRGAKERLEQFMPINQGYSETIDQVSLTARFEMSASYQKCRSFRRLVSAFAALLRGMGVPVADFPSFN